MKKKTAFRLAAERVHDGFSQGCCGAIQSTLVEVPPFGLSCEEYFFIKLFNPTISERKEFKTKRFYWMASPYQSIEQDTNDRILALLICEQIWLSEQNK